MKRIALILILCSIAFGYVPTPAPTLPPTDPNAPQVIGKKTLYVNTEARFEIDIEDANDDTLSVTADGAAVTKKSEEPAGIMDIEVTDANGVRQILKIPIQKTTYLIVFRPHAVGLQYPQIKVTDIEGETDTAYVELDVLRKNVKPVITGCRTF